MKNAKRIVALVLILLLSVSLLCACGGNKEDPSNSSEQETPNSVTDNNGKETVGHSRPPVTLPPAGSVTKEPVPEDTDPIAGENGDNFLGWIFE